MAFWRKDIKDLEKIKRTFFQLSPEFFCESPPRVGSYF